MTGISAAARVIQQRLKDRKLPAVEVPQVDNPELARSIQSIQEHFRMYEGDSGAPKERFVTISELEKAGLIRADTKSGFAYISRVLAKDVSQAAGSTANPTLVDPVKKDTSRQSRIPAAGGGGGGAQQPVAMAAKIGAASDVSVSKPVQDDFMFFDGGEWTNFALFNRANRWRKQQVYDKPFQMLSQAATPEPLANYGFVWSKDDDPTTLWFTDSDGTETQLGTGGSGLDGTADEDISGQWDFNDKVRIILTGGTAADMLHLRDDTDAADFVFHYDGAHWALRSEVAGGGSKFLGFNSSTLAADFGGAVSTPVAVTASGGFYVDSKATDPASGAYVRMMMTAGAGYIDAYDFGAPGFNFNLNIRAQGTYFSQGIVDVNGAFTATTVGADSVTIGDGNSADEDLLIHFNIDRAWKFIATGVDASTALTLRSLGGGGKIFDIQDDSSVTKFTFATASGNFAAVGAITGSAFGGITSANLLDKTAAETLTDIWTHQVGQTASTYSPQQIFAFYTGPLNYRHWMGSRHNGGATHDNAIDFYVWGYGTDAITALGTTRAMTIDADGVFIGTDEIGRLETVSGSFGSIQVDGMEGVSGGWAGYNIGGRHVFMDDGGSTWGLYDDNNNQWAIYIADGSFVQLKFGGNTKLATTVGGVDITGTAVLTGDVQTAGKLNSTKVSVGGVRGSSMNIYSSNVQFSMENTAGGADGKVWNTFVTSGTWKLRLLDDAYSSGVDCIGFTRSGMSLTACNLNAPLTISSNEAWHAGNDGDGSGLDADSVGGIPNTNLMTFTGAQIPNMTDIDDTNVGSTSIGQVMYWDGSLWQPAWAYDLAASLVSQAEAEANAATTIRWWSSLRVGQAVVSAKTIATLWRFTYASEPAPSALQSTLTANFLHIDGKEVIDGNDTYLRLNQNNEFSSGIHTPYAMWVGGNFRVDGNIDLNGNINGDGASNIDNIETITIDGTGDISKTSHGNYLYHQGSYNSDQAGGITFSTSAASGGVNGDIWFKYT